MVKLVVKKIEVLQTLWAKNFTAGAVSITTAPYAAVFSELKIC
jgi:hypothetical protein